MPSTVVGVLGDAETPRPHPLPQAAKKEGGISAGRICRYTNHSATEQNKKHKTVGTLTMEMHIKHKQDTKECTKYPAL